MKKCLACLFMFAASWAGAQNAVPYNDKRFAGLDKQFENLLTDWKAAGFSVAVVERNRVVYAKGFGLRDVAQKQPVTPNTLFAIGSVTKSFTASLIGLLQQAGKLDYDKPVAQYLPSLHFFNNTMNNGVTLRHMMSHQTGLPRHDFSWYLFNSRSTDSLLQRVQYQEPSTGLREKWQYNNFMFSAQGAVAEKLTGLSWEEAVRQQLFAPLEMQRSNFSIAQLEQDADAAKGYGLRGDSAIRKLDYYAINGMSPAGSINSSAAEMTAWLMTWINGGKYKGKEVLPQAYITEAITPQAIVSAGLPTKETPELHFSTYGFGWMMSSYRGHYRVEHGGNIDGFSASAVFFPTDSVGIVVLCNQDRSVIPSIVRNMLSDRLLGLKPIDWHADRMKNRMAAKKALADAGKTKMAAAKGAAPTHALTAFEGRYFHPGYGSIQVYTAKDSLMANTGQHRLWLKHNNYNVFNAYLVHPTDGIDTTDTETVIMQFQLSVTGEIESLTTPFEASLQPLVFKKQLPELAISGTELKQYEGDYDLAGTNVKVYQKNDRLFVLVPGQPEYELTATGNHKFALTKVPGYFVQFALANSKTTELTFMQPNGNFKAVRK